MRSRGQGTVRATRRGASASVPASVQLPVPPGALGPRFPGRGAGIQAPGNGGGPSLGYVAALEEQLRGLTETIHSLEHQLATVAQRNRELEGAHMQLAAYRAETDREVAEGAAATIRAAEQRAANIESEARARSRELIEAVGAEIDALERETEKVRRHEASAIESPTSAPPDDLGVDATTAASVRGQIGDLLKLRESIVQGLRGAVEGFTEELTRLERPPLAAAADPSDAEQARATAESAASERASAGEGGAPLEWNGFTIEVQVEPVAGVLEASRIEQTFAEISPSTDAHLRSVESGAATLSIWGLGPQELPDAIERQFPGATCEWVAEDRLTMRLAPAEAA